MLILIIAGGPDKGRIYELTDGAPIVLGREGDQVKLNDRKVSREHARLWSEGGQWYLKDLGSRHGTHRNHVELERGQHAKLKDGDYLQIGNTVMVLGRMPAAPAERAAALASVMPAGQGPTWRRPAWIAGGASVAALLALGSYLAVKLHGVQEQLLAQNQQTEKIGDSLNGQNDLNQRLLDKTTKLDGALDRHGSAVAKATDAAESMKQATDPILAKLAAAEANAAKQRVAIEDLGKMLASQQDRDNSAEVLAAVTQMKTLLAGQPTGDKLVARLEKAIQDNAEAAGKAVQLALAEHKQSQATVAKSAADTEKLLARVMTALEQVPTREQLAAQMKLAVAESKAKNQQFMKLVLAELRSTGEQIKTDVTAAIQEDAGYANKLMKQVVAELGKRPTGEALAADLRKAMGDALAKGEPDQKQLKTLMQSVLSELEQRPTSEQLAADLRRHIGADAQKTELLIAKVMAELAQRPTATEIAKQLQATDNESAAKTAVLLEQVLSKLNTQQQLTTQIDALRKQIAALPGRDEKAIRAVLARLDQQDKNNTEMLKSIADLRKAVPDELPKQLDKVLAELDKQVRTEQITDAMEKSIERIAAVQDKKTQAALDTLSKRIDALPSSAELAKITKSQDALAKLLDKSDARGAIGELRTTLEDLAKKMATKPDDRLAQIITMLKKREKAELMIAELHDAMGKDSKQAEKLKAELLAAVKSADQPETAKALRELLAAVNSRLATEDSVRQAVRDELRGKLLPNQMSLNDAREVTTSGSKASTGGDGNTPAPRRRLTSLEVAYKQAFETGRAVTIGAGVVNPKTGEVSEGQLIDPAVAKALGFETWRDWYLTDQHAKQMRLQQEAIRQRNANDAKDDGSVKLPPVDAKTGSIRPEQD